MSLPKPPLNPTNVAPSHEPVDAKRTTDSLKETAFPEDSTPAEQSSREQSSSRSNGFDPYNSGAFDRRQTWEKVTRK